jgi:hypothetical protein
MRLAIMQPTYIPWLGYFDLMDQADCFVILDSVQLAQGRSWQKRNRIKTARGPLWLTVPIIHQGAQPILQVRIDGSTDWPHKHWRALEQSYRRAPYWGTHAGEIESLYAHPPEWLAEWNVALLEWLESKLNLTTPLTRASDLPVGGERESLLVGLCKHLGADVYLSPLGSAAYLNSDAMFEGEGIRLEFQNYEHPTYPQLYPPFVSHLSALDLLLNTGPNALEIIRSGRRTALSVSEAVGRVAEAGVRALDAGPPAG